MERNVCEDKEKCEWDENERKWEKKKGSHFMPRYVIKGVRQGEKCWGNFGKQRSRSTREVRSRDVWLLFVSILQISPGFTVVVVVVEYSRRCRMKKMRESEGIWGSCHQENERVCRVFQCLVWWPPIFLYRLWYRLLWMQVTTTDKCIKTGVERHKCQHFLKYLCN